MSIVPRKLSRRRETALFEAFTASRSRMYFPIRGLGGSLLFHGCALTALLSLPVFDTPKDRVPWFQIPRETRRESQFVMYLPSVGGGKQGGGSEQEPAGSEPAPPQGSGKEGMVYPGPQLVRSDSPAPTNSYQTLLQPDLEDLPILQERVELPNLISMPEVGNSPEPEPLDLEPENLPALSRASNQRTPLSAPNLDFVEPRPPEPETVEPEAEEPEVTEPPTPEPEPLPLEVADLPDLNRAANLPNLLTPEPALVRQPSTTRDVAVGLADPDEARNQQPLEISPGAPVEPLRMAVEELPTSRQTRARENLLSAPEVTPIRESTSDQAETIPEVSEEPSAPDSAGPSDSGSQARAFEPGEIARLPGRTTDVPNILSLTPEPTLSGQDVEIPAGEARGRFTISPEAGPAETGPEPGLPGVITLGSAAEGQPGGTGQTDLPSSVTITIGSGGGGGSSGAGSGIVTLGSGRGSGSGPGSGSGSGPGMGTGTGSGTGAGSGEGTSSGSGPFRGISIIGGAGGPATSGSASNAQPGDEPLAGITILGGARRPDEVTPRSVTVRPVPRPVAKEYGLFVISTENSGGGLPFVGVFSEEQIHTVYVDMREDEDDPYPAWPLEFAEPSGEETQTAPTGELEVNSRNFVLPAPTAREKPTLSADLVRKHLGKMVIVYAVVNVKGDLEQMLVTDTPDPLFNGPVLDALSQWIFQPGTLNGEPIPVRLLIGVPLWLPQSSR